MVPKWVKSAAALFRTCASSAIGVKMTHRMRAPYARNTTICLMGSVSHRMRAFSLAAFPTVGMDRAEASVKPRLLEVPISHASASMMEI